MKTNKYSPVLFAIALSVLTGCYKDKGDYDYVNVETMEVTFTPDQYTEYRSGSTFKFKQPLEDTLVTRITPEIKNAGNNSDSRYEYEWISRKDTVHTPYLEIKLPPRESTSLDYLLKITDKHTTLQYYQAIMVRTIIPYINSWFVLHGTEGNMKIGTAERADEDIWVTADAYFDIHKRKRFSNAQALGYSAFGQAGEWTTGERLTIVSGDSLFFVYPFDFTVKKNYEQMMPMIGSRPVLKKCFDDLDSRLITMTDQGKLFISAGSGHYYPMLTPPELANYKASDVLVHNNGYTVVWDAAHKSLYYYNFQENTFGWDTSLRSDAGNKAKLSVFERSQIAEDEFNDKEMLGMVPLVWEDKSSAVEVYMKNAAQEVYSYRIIFADWASDVFAQVTKKRLNAFALDVNNPLAVSLEFANQLFFASGSVLYRYDLTNMETNIVYQLPDASGVISKIVFRKPYESYMNPLAPRTIGIVANYSDNKGEIHELVLDASSDIHSTHAFKGFEQIKDVIFTNDEVYRN